LQPDKSINLGSLLLSLSDALDLASPAIARHQQRTAFAAWRLSEAARLSSEVTERIFIAALLHDIGALTPEDKVAIHAQEAEDPDEHCVRGEALLSGVPVVGSAAAIVRFHHTEWREWGASSRTDVALESQILNLADHVERLIDRHRYILHQDREIVSRIKSLSGTELDPDLVRLFERL